MTRSRRYAIVGAVAGALLGLLGQTAPGLAYEEIAVTGPDGSFSIPDLPPGTYDVIAWHPYMNVRAREITVAANGETSLNFQFDSDEVTIPYYNLQTGYRLEPALGLIPLKTPSVELQTP